MTLVIMQAVNEAAKAAIITIREADNLINNARSIHTMPRSGIPVLRQPTWKVAKKYQELCNFEIEVKNIFMTNNYNRQENERVSITLNWLCWEGIRFMQTLSDENNKNAEQTWECSKC